MIKFLLPLLLLLSLTFTSFSQQGKFRIGNFYLYDSAGTLVISGGDLKVNSNGWIQPKDLNSTVGGLGISVHPTLGLRFNAGTGMEVSSNDTVVSTQELSFAEVDSIAINGLILKPSGVNKLAMSDTITTKKLYVTSLFLNGTTSQIRFAPESEYDLYLAYAGGHLNWFIGDMTFNDKTSLSTILTLDATNSIITSNVDLDFTTGATTTIGTTDNFSLVLQRNNSAYMTLGASDLTIEGNTPLKFSNASIFTTPDGLTMATLTGIPNGVTGAVHTGWVLMKNSTGTIYVPYWEVP